MADDPKSLPDTINFDYIKSSQFRVVYADGAFLALNAHGVSISFFSERQPIPRRTVHKVNPDGTVGDEIAEQRVVRDAVIRDTESAVIMTIDTAKRVREKLDEVIKKFEEAVAKQPKELKTL